MTWGALGLGALVGRLAGRAVIGGWKRALVLAPHTDDGEFGCGGTMARLVEEGAEVRYVAFSIATKSLPDGFAPDTLAREVREATTELGIPESQLTVHDFDVRTFPARRQDILELLIALWEEWPGRRLPAEPPRRPSGPPGRRRRGAARLQADDDPRLRDPLEQLDFAYQAYISLERRHLELKTAALAKYALAAAPALLGPRVHLEHRADARDQREPRVRGGLRGLSRRRLTTHRRRRRAPSPSRGMESALRYATVSPGTRAS